jgi:hypothetical protein
LKNLMGKLMLLITRRLSQSYNSTQTCVPLREKVNNLVSCWLYVVAMSYLVNLTNQLL